MKSTNKQLGKLFPRLPLPFLFCTRLLERAFSPVTCLSTPKAAHWLDTLPFPLQVAAGAPQGQLSCPPILTATHHRSSPKSPGYKQPPPLLNQSPSHLILPLGGWLIEGSSPSYLRPQSLGPLVTFMGIGGGRKGGSDRLCLSCRLY